MKTYELSWQDKQGIKFHVQGWEPATRPKAVVGLIHGLGEHVGRYASIAGPLTRAGYCLAGYDLRGHGRSGGPRGHTPSYDALLDDMAVFLGQIKKRYPKLPVFLYGHSLGGNLVLNFCLRRKPDVRGAIVTAPWLKLAFEPPAWKVALGRLLDPIMPGFTQKSGLKTEALSRDPQVVEQYRDDPLVHGLVSARLYVGSHAAGRWALEHAAEFPLPLLVMQGTEDRLISLEASHEFAVRAGKRATWRAWEGLYHEIHNEAESGRVMSTMISWMNATLRKTAPAPRRAGQKR